MVVEEEDMSQGGDQIIDLMEERKEEKSPSMMEIEQLVVAGGCQEIDTPAHAKQDKGEQLVQIEIIMASVDDVVVEDSLVNVTLTIHDEDSQEP